MPNNVPAAAQPPIDGQTERQSERTQCNHNQAPNGLDGQLNAEDRLTDWLDLLLDMEHSMAQPIVPTQNSATHATSYQAIHWLENNHSLNQAAGAGGTMTSGGLNGTAVAPAGDAMGPGPVKNRGGMKYKPSRKNAGRKDKPRPGPWASDELAHAQQLRAQLWTIPMIAHALGRTVNSVGGRLWRASGGDPKRAEQDRKRDREGRQ